MAIRRPTSDGHIKCLESFLNLPALCTGKSKIFEKNGHIIYLESFSNLPALCTGKLRWSVNHVTGIFRCVIKTRLYNVLL